MKTSELTELQEELNSMKPEEKKEAVKQVIAMMTIGKDVSSLFPHVVKCMETSSIELKKLVYLYIINYAKSKPDLTIMAINTFRKDAHEKQNPLIRALAVRTMGCIRIERITEYLCESLKDCLIDDDPYVKKTAAITVAKLYGTSPRLVRDHGFIKTLQNMI
jgi:vesicle coat complex subunit